MKNIFLLPTDKPTWLHKSLLTGILRKSSSCINDMKQAQGTNIYIASDEENKDWCYYENGDLKGIHKVLNGTRPKTMSLKKIILTTDQDLIKDGVQKIDDTFLEWFVNNSDCEFVETKISLPWESSKEEYEVVIPQEKVEHKGTVLTTEEVTKERSYSELELFITELKDKIDSFEYSINQQSYISEYVTEWFEQNKKT